MGWVRGRKKRGQSKAAAPKRRWWQSRVFWVLGFPLLGGVGLAAFIALALAYYTIALPHPMVAGQDRRPSVIRILGANGDLIAERGVPREYIPLDLLPKHLPDAVLAIEDRRFFEHPGIDFPSLVRALAANIQAGRTVQGGSTLTQQLAKNLFLKPDRHLARKLEEVLLSLWLEVRLTKREILELYLNRVYFGAGAHGIENASERYFGKSARHLTLPEAAVLAGLLKAPSKFSPLVSPGLARSRARVVLKKMQETGVVAAEQAREAAAQSVLFSLARPSRQQAGAEYAVDYVMEQVLARLGDVHGDLTIETTLDGELQKAAQAILGRHVLLEGEAQDASQGAAVILDRDGSVRALVGGRAYAESQYNRATKGRRQPGSAFKPFIFLAAVEGGLTPASFVSDEQVTVKGWAPRNYSGEFKGAVSLRDGLAQSVNSVAVRLFLDLGRRRVIATARRLGITSELLDGPSLALGTSEVTPLELTNAYVPFANGGAATTPIIVRRVVVPEGRILMEAKPRVAFGAIEPKALAAMTDMLQHTVTAGTGRTAALARHPVAGKTGTSQDFRDAWFVGYTGHLVGSVWIGNDNGKPMHSVVGGALPAKIWREIMTAAHARRTPLPLGQPLSGMPSTVARKIDPAAAASANNRIELSTGSTLPARLDDALVQRVVSDLGRSQR